MTGLIIGLAVAAGLVVLVLLAAWAVQWVDDEDRRDGEW